MSFISSTRKDVSNYRNFIDRNHDNLAGNVKNYFEHFHPSLPLLHRPTFTVSSAPKLLLDAVSLVGSLFSTNPCSDEEAQARAHWQKDAWHSGQLELQNMVPQTPSLLSSMCGDAK